jgi:hypothetical protein
MLLCNIIMIVSGLWGLGSVVAVFANRGLENLWCPQKNGACDVDVRVTYLLYQQY